MMMVSSVVVFDDDVNIFFFFFFECFLSILFGVSHSSSRRVKCLLLCPNNTRLRPTHFFEKTTHKKSDKIQKKE